MKVKRENRTLFLTDIPTNVGEKIVRSCSRQLSELEVRISHTGFCTEAIVLDNIVIPMIVKALRKQK